MKTLYRLALAPFAVLLLSGAASAATGPEIFQAQKCNSCHKVTAAGIARLPNPDEEGKDLSHVGSTYDKKAIASFLLKKTEHNGEKHKKAFGGTTEELKTVATWLESLK